MLKVVLGTATVAALSMAVLQGVGIGLPVATVGNTTPDVAPVPVFADMRIGPMGTHHHRHWLGPGGGGMHYSPSHAPSQRCDGQPGDPGGQEMGPPVFVVDHPTQRWSGATAQQAPPHRQLAAAEPELGVVAATTTTTEPEPTGVGPRSRDGMRVVVSMW